LPQDYWLQLVDEHQDLHKTLLLVEAIAQGDVFKYRRAVRSFAPNDDAEFWVGGSSPDGLDVDPVLGL
jgi:hypothetical protein